MQIIVMRCSYPLYAEEKKIDKILGKIRQDKYLNKIAVLTMAMALHFEKIVLASDGLGKIDALGLRFLGVIQKIGYWFCIIMCLVEILRNVSSGDYKKIGAIIAKYLMIMAALYGIKWAFDIVVGAFS